VVTQDQAAKVREAVREFDDHLAMFVATGPNRDLHIFITAPGSNAGAASPGAAAMPFAVPAGAIRVGGTTQQAMLESQPRPIYPPLAKQARIQGTVSLNAVIGPDGHVDNLSVMKGHPLLVQAALDAVKDWVYKPTLMNGNPVAVVTQIDVNFTLSQ
jgi:protein TonB